MQCDAKIPKKQLSAIAKTQCSAIAKTRRSAIAKTYSAVQFQFNGFAERQCSANA
jgi:hypothetical protein